MAIRRMGQGAKVNVEYVSANPTGPLHVAHARGAVVGDALANLLHKAGYAVTKEYYINDAGAQVDKLGQSTYLRYREALGDHIAAIPEGLYPGEYLKDVGAAIAKRDGARWIDKPEADWLPEMRAFAIATLMAEIKTDLATLGVNIDVYSSRRALVESGAVDAPFQELSRQDLIYQGQLEPPKGEKPGRLGGSRADALPCDASSATRSTGRSRSRTGAGPTSPTISPIITTSSVAASAT